MEVGSTGPGGDTSKRVKWAKILSRKDVKYFIDVNTYLNYDGWMEKQPSLQA